MDGRRAGVLNKSQYGTLTRCSGLVGQAAGASAMSFDGRDESLGEGDAEAGGPPQVPSQGGRAGIPQRGRPAEAEIPAQGGEPIQGSVPAQRDRREDRPSPA